MRRLFLPSFFYVLKKFVGLGNILLLANKSNTNQIQGKYRANTGQVHNQKAALDAQTLLGSNLR